MQLTHFFPREISSSLYAQHYASSLIIIVCLSPKAAPTPGHVIGLKGPIMPAPTEPHEPKSSLLGSKITKSKESPASQCGNTAQGVAEHGRKSVKPQLMMANRLKAPILLIRCYSTGNLDMLWTTVQNVHRIFKLKVTDLREFPVVQWLRFSAFTAMTQVQFLVRELRSCKPQTVWPKKKRERLERNVWHAGSNYSGLSPLTPPESEIPLPCPRDGRDPGSLS